jgi:hypothetical protein
LGLGQPGAAVLLALAAQELDLFEALALATLVVTELGRPEE